MGEESSPPDTTRPREAKSRCLLPNGFVSKLPRRLETHVGAVDVVPILPPYSGDTIHTSLARGRRVSSTSQITGSAAYIATYIHTTLLYCTVLYLPCLACLGD